MKFKIEKTSLEYQLKVAIAEAVSKVMGRKIEPEEVHLEHPDNEEWGDCASNIALKLKEVLRLPDSSHRIRHTQDDTIALEKFSDRVKLKNQRELAERIVKEIKQNKDLSDKVEGIKVEGAGFINIAIKNEWFVRQLQRVINEGEKYGTSNIGKWQTWLIEHTSPNPNKAMHLGHLRNNVTGMAIANIWEALGIKVIRDCIDNNRGIAIAKLMWGYLKFAHKEGKKITDINYWYENQNEWSKPQGAKMRPDKFVDHLYVLASGDFKNKEVEKRVRKLVVDWEKEDKKTWALWRKVLSYSYGGQELTLKRLGNKWDRIWHEHEHYKKGKELVKQGLEKGVFKKLKNGAILSDLERYGLTDTVLIKSDGTALYITQDLALTKLKRETFEPDRLFWVIGPEQSLALRQLFAICEQLRIGSLSDFTHIAYGYMSIKGQGKMSSRAGNVVYIDDLIDESKKIILEKIDAKRFKKEEIDILAEKIAVGAVKYSVLKVGRLVDMAFDFKQSLSFEGNSGPYLQYTYARAKSVLARANFQFPISNFQFPISNQFSINKEELSILRWLYRYPEVVWQAGQEYAPNLIANFLYELSQRFNTFYAKHSILQPQNAQMANGKWPMDEEKNKNKTISNKQLAISQFRLLLTAAVGQVIKNGLYLLGIEAPRKM